MDEMFENGTRMFHHDGFMSLDDIETYGFF